MHYGFTRNGGPMRRGQEASCTARIVVVTRDAVAKHLIGQHNLIQPRVPRVGDGDVERRRVACVAVCRVDAVRLGHHSQRFFHRNPRQSR